MLKLFKNPSVIVTVDTRGKNIKRGKEMNELLPVESHSIVVEGKEIKDFIPNSSVKENDFDEVIDLSDKTVLPGLIECHTHTAYAGSRADEFRMKLAGVDYEEIARKGGGIATTVQSVRNSSFDELISIITPRVNYFISQGVTVLEIKSGYGLSFYDEIKLLQVINHLDSVYEIDIIPTFLGAHIFPPEYRNDQEKYINMITNEMIPFIAENNLAKFCDAFCEETAFSATQTERIFTVAKENGLELKLHTEQFNNIGGLEVALKMNAVSADHLEVIKDEDILKTAESETVSVLLPGVSFFLDYDYAPARKLIDGNAIVALATDFNPGSSHIAELNLIMSLAAIKMKMSIEETISAVTINAAKAVKMNETVGSLEIGKRADFSVFNTKEYADIVYNVGKNLNVMTIKNGKVIYQ